LGYQPALGVVEAAGKVDLAAHGLGDGALQAANAEHGPV
jgi:hypothetical protein